MRLARALDAGPSPLGAASGTAATPFIFHYPKLIPEGRIETRYYAHVKDIMATCLDLTGASGSRLHGYAVLPTRWVFPECGPP